MKIHSILVFVILYALTISGNCRAQSYIAHYSATYQKVTPKWAYEDFDAYSKYLIANGDTQQAQIISAWVNDNQNPEFSRPTNYKILVGCSGKSILCVISRTDDNVQDVMLYDGDNDCSYSIHRQPGSIGDVWIDRGLNTYKLPFVPLTGIGGPFLKYNQASDTYAYPFPLEAAPPKNTPGAYTQLIYVAGKLQQSSTGSRLISTDTETGLMRFVWDFERDHAPSNAPPNLASGKVTRTDFTGIPDMPFTKTNQKRIAAPKEILTSRLDSFNDANVDPSFFQIGHWLQRMDSISDNRHQVLKIAYYQNNYGGIDEQLFRPFKLPGAPAQNTSSHAGVVAIIVGLIGAACWVLYRRRRSRL